MNKKQIKPTPFLETYNKYHSFTRSTPFLNVTITHESSWQRTLTLRLKILGIGFKELTMNSGKKIKKKIQSNCCYKRRSRTIRLTPKNLRYVFIINSESKKVMQHDWKENKYCSYKLQYHEETFCRKGP